MSDDVLLTPWYFIRHAPVLNAKQGLYNSHDEGAILPDVKVIEKMSRQLPNDALWYVSPFKRATQTALALTAEPDNIKYANALKEQNFGDWQGLKFDELWQEIKNIEGHNWSYISATTKPPKGESFCDVQRRVRKFLDEIVDVEPTKPRIIVTHAGVIRAFISLILNVDADVALSFKFDTFSLTTCLHQTGSLKGGAWQMQSLNQTFTES